MCFYTMFNHSKNIKYFHNDHLTNAGMSIYVDAMIIDNYTFVPEPITNHIEKCDKCKRNALELFEMLHNDNEYFNQVSEFYANKDKPLGIEKESMFVRIKYQVYRCRF